MRSPFRQEPADISPLRRWTRGAIAALTVGLLLTGAVSATASATTVAGVDLGRAASYTVLSSAAFTNDGASTIPGNVGAVAAITGESAALIGGTVHRNDSAVAGALSDLESAYRAIVAMPNSTVITSPVPSIVLPGVYSSVAALGVTTSITLDAQNDPNAYFVFQVGAAINTTASTHMTLTNGAQASHVFWQAAGAVTLGASSDFVGTILSGAAITAGANTSIDGRALTVLITATPGDALATTGGAINTSTTYFGPVTSLDAATLTIAGGSTATTATQAPTLSGTTNAAAGTKISITIDGVPYSTLATVDGIWSFTAPELSNGVHAISVSVTTPAGIATTVSQSLTVAIPAPAPEITIDGGTDFTSSDATPTITGTSSAASGTVITVTIDGTALTTVVDDDGNWSIEAGSLDNGIRWIVASVTDAGGTATATQALTIAVPVPDVDATLTIDGGDFATVDTATSLVSGTSSSDQGTIVSISVDGTVQTTTVDADGNWSASVGPLANGAHAIVASDLDGAVLVSASQTLTVAVVISTPVPAPTISINGGAHAYTTDRTPTVSGTTTAAIGSKVTVKLGNRSRTAKVNAGHGWTVTFAKVSYGNYAVSAVVKSAAGTGKDTQKLTIRASIPPKLSFTDGATDTTSDRTPKITGSTNAKVGSTVTVTLNGKKETSKVSSSHTWSVTFDKVPYGIYTVVASAKNSAGTGTATQVLTIRAVPPVVVPPVVIPPVVIPPEAVPIWTVGYNDQVIQGTTDAAVGTLVTVTVGWQVLQASVQPGGLWGIRLNHLGNAAYDLTVSVASVTTQVRLIVSGTGIVTTEPAVTLGCAPVNANGEATINFYGHSLTASMHQYGLWSMEPAKAADCGYVVVASPTDEAGDTGIYSRVPVSTNPAPTVTIDGGDTYTAIAHDDPNLDRISGTSSAPVGSRVRMRMSGQTLIEYVKADGTWSFHRNVFDSGVHQLVVGVIDASTGITGFAVQSITIP